MLYHAYQTQADLLGPWHALAEISAAALGQPAFTRSRLARNLAAACEVFSAGRLSHTRPHYGILTVSVRGSGDRVPVIEERILKLPFATLLRFRRQGVRRQPKVLIVAPMSGHFATLLRDTVRTMLGDHDVYITDWHNARDVPLDEGRFGLSEYTDHLVRFLEAMGPGSHVLAICQPCVSALAAAAVMSEDDHPALPRTLTLMAGPIDCRINPTEVNRLAIGKPIEWFRRNLISTVPYRHPGAMRQVYPGFVQLLAFMQMNLDRHLGAFRTLYCDLRDGQRERARATRTFYDEYFAVLDLTADFYLETVQHVFQEHALPRRRLRWHDRVVDTHAIRRMALLTVEGERDDICAIGQTVAAHDLCPSIRPYLKQHHVQTEVGHYGVFAGKRWQASIYPRVRDHIHAND
jgi:poly(3-hydroxybutyrate) depolymerase